jgi:serine/threonine protein kinase
MYNNAGYFAMKTFRTGRDHDHDASSFSREISILRELTQHTHNHIVSLLATYETSYCHHLILPWADCDLEEFWNKDPQSRLSSDAAMWLAQQTKGLVDALYCIHRTFDAHAKHGTPPEGSPYGRHGDLKPANILWFPSNESRESSILRIAILDASAFTRTEDREHSKSSMSAAYQAPEIKLRTRTVQRGVARTATYPALKSDIGAGSFTSQADIWALGCIFLEFVCWHAGGTEFLERFRSEREISAGGGSLEDEWFFEDISDHPHDQNKVRLRGAVVSRLSSLKRQGDELVRHIARIIPQMLSVNPETRLTPKQVLAKLEGIDVTKRVSKELPRWQQDLPVTPATSAFQESAGVMDYDSDDSDDSSFGDLVKVSVPRVDVLR